MRSAFPSGAKVRRLRREQLRERAAAQKNLHATNIAISALVIARMLMSMIPNTNCTTQPI